MPNAALAAALAQAFRDACEIDLRALKPGNVGLHGDGHGMDCEAFRASAEAAAEPLTRPGSRIGQRILDAVEATRSVVACNTNLGIVLLCAPLVHAALEMQEGEALRPALERSLAALDVADARLAYAAIRLARPGGLGSSPRHDVRDEPVVTLLAAMREAQARDAIAAQYANGFTDVFELGLPMLRHCRARRQGLEWAATAVYLRYASRLPDSHVARRHGTAAAQRLAQDAALHAARLAAAADPARLSGELLDWDRRLKDDGINPGTSADLTVATVLAAGAQELLYGSKRAGKGIVAAGAARARRGSVTGAPLAAARDGPTKRRGEPPWQESPESA